MATNAEVAAWLQANPNATDAEIVAAAQAAGVSAQQLSDVTGVSLAEVQSRIAAVPSITAQSPAPAEWDYNAYQENLKTGDVDYSTMLGTLAAQSPVMAQDAQNVYKEILAQQKAGSAEYWYQGDTASKEAAAADFALRLAENGIGSLSELGQEQVFGAEEFPTTQYINKATGEALPRQDLLGRGLSALDIDYQVAFNDQGQAIPYTTNRTSGWVEFRDTVKPIAAMIAGSLLAPGLSTALGSATGLTGANLSALTGATLGAGGAALTGNDILTGALLGGAGGYVTGLSDVTGDFAGINSSLTPAQIESGLGTPGYGYGAQAASSGLFDPAVIGSGANVQTSYPYDYADLAAADTSQLYGQVGANAPAIEQNLIAAGVDPLVAADAANQVILNPNMTVSDLTNYLNTNYTGTGGIYDVNVGATYPTIPATVAATTGTAGTAGTAGTTPTNITAKDVLNAAQIAAVVGGVTSAVTPDDTGFDIVPVPADWKTPTYGQAANWQAPAPIDFGSPEMLRGTQWEKYLGQLPDYRPTIAQAPMTMSYPQLVSALQGGGGANLTIGDIISGIQGQYGQTPAMG